MRAGGLYETAKVPLQLIKPSGKDLSFFTRPADVKNIAEVSRAGETTWGLRALFGPLSSVGIFEIGSLAPIARPVGPPTWSWGFF